jgi:flagellar motor component MotA
MGLITANRLTEASVTRLLQVSALLFFVGALIGGLMIKNSVVPAVDEVAARQPELAPSR